MTAVRQVLSDFYLRAASVMGSLLVVAICAWIGVVWQTGDRILMVLHDMRGEYHRLSTTLQLHRQEPWHAGMQTHLRESEQMMSVTRSRLERLERDHAKLAKDLRL